MNTSIKYSKMKDIKSIIFSILLFVLPLIGYATHIVGGDMTYKKISSNAAAKTSKFLITMNLRRDCFLGAENAQFDINAKIRIYRTNGQLFLETTMPYMDDDTLNNYVQSDCGFEGAQVCVHETRYLKTIDLPSWEGGYIIAYQRCCRNGSINNIVDPLETGATYSVTIPKESFTTNNSSPSFKKWPDVYICAQKNLDFDNSAIDPDGDSLVYKLCVPKIGLTKPSPEGFPSAPPYTDLTWKLPYGLNNLMGGVPLTIDARTGRMTAIPNAVGQFVVGVCVEEYRNGSKIGEIRRDFQYNVRICSQPPKAIFNAPSNLCNETKIVFENNSLASNRYEWNFNFPSNDTLFKSTERNPTFTFPGNGTYKVKLTVIRNSDNCRDEVVKTIKITDLPYNADFEYDIKACNPDGTISAILTDKSSTADVGAVSNKWNWVLTQGGNTLTSTTNPAEFIIDPADFNVKLDVGASNACSGSVSRNVIFNSKIFESDFDVELGGCDPKNDLLIILKDKSQELNDNYIVTERKWLVSYGASTISLFGNNVIVTIPRKDFTVVLDVNTDKNCRNTLTKDFKVTDFIPSIDFDYSLSGCDIDNKAIIKMVEKSNDSVNYAQVSAYTWTFKNETLTGKNIEYITSLQDSFVSTLTLTFDDNCTATIAKSISINELRPKLDFSYIAADCPDDQSVNLVFKYEDKDNKGLSTKGINWLIGNKSNILNYLGTPTKVTVPKDSIIFGSIQGEFENGCKDLVEKQFLPGPFATLQIIQDSLVLCPEEKKALIMGGNPAFDYFWSPTIGLDLTVPSNPILTAKTDQVYDVIVADGLCTVKGKVVVEVLESLNLAIEGEAVTCDGSVLLSANGGFGNGFYEWYKDANFTQKVAMGDTLKTSFNTLEQTYYVNFKSDKFCSAKPASIKVVNQSPRFEIIGPYQLCIGDTIPTNNVFNNEPSHINGIKWDANPHIISGGTTLKPVVGTINPNETEFTLYFTAVNQYNCTHRDSLKFEIIPNPVVDFNYNVKDCNNFEVCMTFLKISGDQLYGLPKWDFGNDKSVPGSVGLEVCNKYAKAGEYTITLSNLSVKCPFKPISKQVKLNDTFPVFDNDKAEDCINTDYMLVLPDKAKNRPFVWQDAKGNVISTQANPKVDIKSDTIFILNVKDENGCAFNDTFSVKAFKFDVALSAQDEVCAYGIYPINSIVNAGINFQYVWSPANAIVSGGNTGMPTVDIAKSTKYTLKLTHPDLLCIAENDITFKIFKFDAKLNEPDVFCLNQTSQPSITVLPNIDYIYEWSPKNLIVSGGNTAMPIFSVKGNDKIAVKVTHPTLGCVLRDSFVINTTELTLDVAAQPNGDIPKGQIVEVSIVDPKQGWKYNWSNEFIGIKQSIKVDEDITFTITATDQNGCTGTTEIALKIRLPQCEKDVFIPTAFSPNDDGVNDVLMVKSNYITEMELIIYNRWGQEVFSSKTQKDGWDGRLRGEELSPDVYAYWLKAKCGVNDEIIKKGNISLIR